MKIVLGSASKQRRTILERKGWSFEVMPADIDEKAIRHGDPLIAPFVERIEGTPDSIEGLPIEITERLMKKVA